MAKEILDRMKSLVRTHDTCVLATVSEGRPHCSLMAYAVDDACRDIFMVTRRDTAKYRNLTTNPHVSLLIDTREEHTGDSRFKRKALTVTGGFCPIEDQEARRLARDSLIKSHSYMKDFVDHPDAEIFSVKASSFLLLDGLTDAHFEAV